MNNNTPSSEKRSNDHNNEASQERSSSKSGDGAIQNDTMTPDAIDTEHWEFLLAELVHLIGLFIIQAKNPISARATDVLFDQLVRHMEILNKMPGHDGCVLIRRTHCKVPSPPLDRDYFATFGHLMVRLTAEGSQPNGNGKNKSAHLQGALKQAFDCFANQGIDSLSIQLSNGSPKKTDLLRLAFNIIARFKMAVNDRSSIRFRCYGRALTFSVIHDAVGRPDVNLTLTAALNGLSPVNARELIKQAEAFHTLRNAGTQDKVPQASVSSYNQIFSARSLRSQIIKPPVEMNNLPWLDCDAVASMEASVQSASQPEERADATDSDESYIDLQIALPSEAQEPEPAVDTPEQLMQLLTPYIPMEDDRHASGLDALMADDYGQLVSGDIAKRLVSLTQLLHMLEKKCTDASVVERVIEFFRRRFKNIQDVELSCITPQRRGLKIASKNRVLIVGLVHPRLFDLVSLVSEHLTARRRMEIIKKVTFNFDFNHMADLSSAFCLSEKEGRHVLGILKDCFSFRGSFIRPTFESRIPLMTEFGNVVFEILWCFLKETPRRQDRLNFLNALQLLMAKLTSPKRAIQYLLADICQTPSEIVFTDRNAFSLANILLHQENKELYVDINRTPESVLATGRKINTGVKKYVVWRLDTDRARMLAKLRTLHRILEETMRVPPGKPRTFDISFLMALEREAIIFMGIVGGRTSRIYLRELIRLYGSPESTMYQNASLKMYLPEIMAQLQIVVRSLGRAGKAEDVEYFRELEQRSKTFYQLDAHPAQRLKVQQLMSIIPQTIKTME